MAFEFLPNPLRTAARTRRESARMRDLEQTLRQNEVILPPQEQTLLQIMTKMIVDLRLPDDETIRRLERLEQIQALGNPEDTAQLPPRVKKHDTLPFPTLRD